MAGTQSRRDHGRACAGALLAATLLGAMAPPALARGVGDPVRVVGVQRLLVVPVRFPDVTPQRNVREITAKVERVADWIRSASYGQASIEFRVLDWQSLPAPLAEYRVSPYNFEVDRSRVRRLVEEALSAAAQTVRLADFTHAYIVVGAHTMPGTGYGMIAYAANPGMLSGVRRFTRLETIRLKDGSEFNRGVIVSAENVHPGHAIHDLLHALGGAHDGRRPVPDLYDFEMQSRPPPGAAMHPATFAIDAGPWDIMSQHFVEVRQPPPPPSSFTRLQLGWIQASQVVTVRPGETQTVLLEPLESGGRLLVVKVPLDARRYLLLENRQKTGLADVLPSSGLLVLEVNEERDEGSGIVRVANADRNVPGLVRAPFVPGSAYVNEAAGVAAVPLAIEQSGRLRVLVTTPDEARRSRAGR